MSHKDFSNQAWYDARWADVPHTLQEQAVKILQWVISEEDFELIRCKHAKHGPVDWIHHFVDIPADTLEDAIAVGMAREGQTTWSGHHGFGTSIRNILRDRSGMGKLDDPELGGPIRDHDLPAAPYEGGNSYKNWDDYYVQAIEAAAGLR